MAFLITKELIFGFRILDLKNNFSASLIVLGIYCFGPNEKSEPRRN